ncbi:H-NS histone family protein [Burkholderia sp. RS02]|uniref:H-NS histone family protein n=1 Tax=unclassified Burkholderia TaxID=2613784 RepID=UPI0032184FAD
MKGATYQQLTAELRILDGQIERSKQSARRNVMHEICELMARWGISSNELNHYRRGEHITKPTVPKYRDPVSGQTWSGRGREPAWIAGKDRTAFRIDPAELPTDDET